jgi:hypothetical protein
LEASSLRQIEERYYIVLLRMKLERSFIQDHTVASIKGYRNSTKFERVIALEPGLLKTRFTGAFTPAALALVKKWWWFLCSAMRSRPR